MTPAGIESATFRFVAQHLNSCATAVPQPTSRSRVLLLEERIVSRLVQNAPSFDGIWLHSQQPTICVSRESGQFSPHPPYGFLKTYVNIILPSVSAYFKQTPSFKFAHLRILNWFSSHNSSPFCVQKYYFLSKKLYYLKIDTTLLKILFLNSNSIMSQDRRMFQIYRQ